MYRVKIDIMCHTCGGSGNDANVPTTACARCEGKGQVSERMWLPNTVSIDRIIIAVQYCAERQDGRLSVITMAETPPFTIGERHEFITKANELSRLHEAEPAD